MKTKLFLLVFTLSFFTLFSQDWTIVKSDEMDDVVFVEGHMPSQFQLYSIDLDDLKEKLQNTASRKDIRVEESTILVDFPNEQGNMTSYRMVEWSIMDEELEAKFPMIKTYVGQSMDKNNTVITMSIGTDGLHVMYKRSGKSAMFIDPYTRDRNKYILYTANNLPAINDEFSCNFENEEGLQARSTAPNETEATDGKLRDYRLAVATTIEYSSFHLSNQGVSSGSSMATKKAAVLSAIVTTMNRVKGIYVLELGITMTLIANEDSIIFITSDNFDNSNSGNSLLNQSQTQITNIIGSGNFDVGHTFSTGGGGVAIRGGICWSQYKAMAITGLSQPIGDKYSVDYVAHEMGHHFGANHTFNTNTNSNNCGAQRNSGTAAEPGGGSTIMAYAGICGFNANIQNNSDAYFHYYSVTEIFSRVTTTSEPNCAQITTYSNAEPTANAGANRNIPKGTAYILEGESTDANGDTITYCWEQTDKQIVSNDNIESSSNTGGPLYRSLMPTTSPNRYMPKFSMVKNGSLVSTSSWEVTPTWGRQMNFRLTTRDNNANVGQTNSDALTLMVINNAGPFRVTSQSTSFETWVGGETKTISWDVAGTTSNGINTTSVKISMVDLVGTELAVINANTANDGSETITVPNVNNNFGVRIMVRAINNVYYAINSKNINVSFVAGISDMQGFDNYVLNPNPNTGNFNISLNSVTANDLSIAIYDMLGRQIYNKQFSNNQNSFNQNIQLNDVQSGIYIVQVSDGVRFNSEKIIIK